MAQLDRFFGVLVEKGARELRLAAGRAPVLVFPEGPRAASSARPSGPQVLALLAEVLPPEAIATFRQNGHLAATLERPGLPALELELTGSPEQPSAVVRPATAPAPRGIPVAPPDPPGAPAPEPTSPPPAATAPAAAPHEAVPPPSPPAREPAAAASAPAGPPEPAAVAPGPAPTAAATPPPAPAAMPSPAAPATAAQEPPPAPGDGPPINALFQEMISRGASDLHVSSGERPMLRVDGGMLRIESWPVLGPDRVMELLLPIMPDKNREEFERTADTDFAYEIPGLARFRANIFRDRKGPGAVFRVIPSKILTAEDLGLSSHILDLCRLTKGLVLVTGPTGSGKSTTLTALIDHINTIRNDHIITIEDPIEFVHENRNCLINQREVGTHTESFKRALRAALREDPDIVLVGEMRDLETISIAIETAETGHLVFGTLHTTTAVSTVDRIIDQFPADRQAQVRMMLSESLKGVISQTLCRKIGGGRIAALEVLIGIPSVANLIREGKTFQIPSIMQTGKRYGMITLNEALLNLVREEKITAEEAYMKSVDKTTMLDALRREGCDLSFLESAGEPAPA